MKPVTHSQDLGDDAGDTFVSSYDTDRSLREDAGGFDASDRTSGAGAREDVPARDERPNPPDEHRQSRLSARAYQRYLDRGAEDGHDVEDWLEAEREMAAEDTDDQ